MGQWGQRGFCPSGVKASLRAVEPGDLACDNSRAYRTSGRMADGGGGVGVHSLLGSEVAWAREQTLLGCCITLRTQRDKKLLVVEDDRLQLWVRGMERGTQRPNGQK